MEPLNMLGTRVAGLLHHHRWERDLQRFGGPLLSVFRDETTDSAFLYHWVDCNDQSHRWLVSSIRENRLACLADRRLSIREAIVGELEWGFLVDMDGEGVVMGTSIVYFDKLPTAYIPAQEYFIDVDLRPVSGNDSRVYTLLLERLDEYGVDGHGKLPKSFTEVFGLIHYAESRDSEGPLAGLDGGGGSILAAPHRGGYSAANMYRSLRSKVTANGALRVERYQYASPGVLQFSVASSAMDRMLSALRAWWVSYSEVNRLVKRIATYCRKNELNKRGREIDVVHQEVLRPLGAQLAHCMIYPTWSELEGLGLDPFQACKVLMAHHRRIEELLDFAEDGTVAFTEVRFDHDE